MPNNKDDEESLHCCNSCNFTCKKKSNWLKHLSTQKHQKLISSDSVTNTKSYKCDSCNKSYKHSSSYYHHKKTCFPNKQSLDNDKSIYTILSQQNENLMEQNKQLLEQYTELKTLIMDLYPK